MTKKCDFCLQSSQLTRYIPFAVLLIICSVLSFYGGIIYEQHLYSHIKSIFDITQIPQKSSPLLKYGLPSGHNLRYFGEFILSYDKKSRIPFWVLEYLTHDSLQKLGSTSRKNKKFMEDFYFEKHFRAYHRDYTNSTYDRGHHAAAGNHVNSDEAMKHTFFLSNIAPQVGKHFNQGNCRFVGIWVSDDCKNENLYLIKSLPYKWDKSTYWIENKNDENICM